MPIIANSQVSITGAGSYSQDFNTLVNTGTAIPWVDNSTIPNWFSQRTGTGTTYNAGNGSSNAGALYSFGSTASSDRSLGSIGSANATAGHFAHGVQFKNDGTSIISDFTVSYTMEQWRNGGTATIHSLTCYYQISSSMITLLNPNNNAAWIAVSTLDAAGPIATITAAALDGNLITNQVQLASISLPGVTLAIGEYLMIKWEDPDQAGGDHGLSIDNLSVQWLASCNTTNSFSITNCTSYTVPSGDETYTISGIFMDTIPNAALCDSIMTIDVTITTGITYYADTDIDGLGDPNNTTVGCSLPLGYVTNSNDCDDTNNSIGAATTIFYLDADSDNFGNPTSSIIACSAPIGYVSNSTDCNDANASINPLAIDIPDNGIDEDCSGSDASATGTQIGLYEFTAAAACPVTALSVTSQPSNAIFSDYSSTGTSCSSANNVFSNSNWNLAATIDLAEYNEFSISANDCSTLDLNRIIFTHRISASGGTPTWTLRSSVDNYTSDLGTGPILTTDKIDTINLSAAFDALTQVVFRFYITNMGTNGATWRNDNVRVIGNFGALTPQTYYADADSDTYGNPSSSISVCTPPAGYVLDNTDCNDNNGLINPMTTWFEDIDGDLTGNTAVTFVGCTPPIGYVLISGDCDDNNSSISNPTTYYLDADSDGFGSMSGSPLVTCTNPGAGYVTVTGDCNDNDFNVNPNSPEICDGLDNNCNFSIDEGLTFVAYYVDGDNDSFGAGTAQSLCEDPGAGYSLNNTDCNDANDMVYPGATEIADDGIDQNCDGVDGYLGIDAIDGMIFSIYPNPSNGIITISFNNEVAGNIICTDLNGKVISTVVISSSNQHIDLSQLSNGNYLLKIVTEQGIRQHRIVIQK